jgi:tetratricopeptide (TPR) repeat protein
MVCRRSIAWYRALTLMDRGRFAEAIEEFDRAALVNRPDIFALVQKGRCYIKLGNELKALQQFDAAMAGLEADTRITAADRLYIEEYIASHFRERYGGYGLRKEALQKVSADVRRSLPMTFD